MCTRPTLSTIEKYADAVGVLVEIRVRIRRQLPGRALKPDAKSFVCFGSTLKLPTFGTWVQILALALAAIPNAPEDYPGCAETPRSRSRR